MSVGRLVRHFQSAVKVPLDLNDVVRQVQALVPDHVVEIHAVDRCPSKLKGMCHKERRTPTLPGSVMVDTVVHRVIYSSRMSLKEQRLVCCKELIHVVDPDPIVVRTNREVVLHAEKMTARKGVGDLTRKSDLGALLDNLAKWQAVAMLFPHALWEEWMPRFNEGTLSSSFISERLQIPEEYVEATMSDEWIQIREALVAFG